ncbi:MAG: N-6 DNA methylase [Bacteroidetes bacterium]|nr:N-6 DNA methylase [Bacteroidota bacterium]
MDSIRASGKIYTPRWVVDYMLILLLDESLKDLQICNSTCGPGDFLVSIAEHVCERARKASHSNLPRYIATLRKLTGYNVDEEAVKHCQERLSSVVRKRLGQDLSNEFWQVRKIDAMDTWEHDQGRFNWVLGNPPYVRIQHLESDRKDRIKRSGWSYFYGSSDLYIVFFLS